MRRFVAVDSGKFATKAVIRRAGENPDKRLKFLTRMDNSEADFGLLTRSNTHAVEFDGKKYRVGDGASLDSFVETKTEDIHRICTYTALASLVDNGDEVTLGIGCPLSVFINKEQREKYESFMRGNGEVNITVDGIAHMFRINKVLVLPESAGIVYLNFEKYKDRLVGVIDLGGLNTNCCIYDKIAPVLSSIFTTRLGGKRMCKSMLDRLNSELGLDVPLAGFQMDDVMECGYVPNRRFPEKEALSKEIIHDYRMEHVRGIYNSCIEHNWSLDTIDLVFIGGTSLLLKDEIKEVFGVGDDCFFEDADFINALGYLRALS